MEHKFIVILENDGSKPSTSYYERREKLALKVRGGNLDQNLAPLARRSRSGEESAAIIQEGCIITGSESQARLVATLASDYGIKAIYIGTADLRPFEVSDADQKAYDLINAKMSRKGRKPDPEEFVVSCWECQTTWEVFASEVMLCPNCHGVNIQVRLGHAARVPTYEEGENILAYWQWSRWQAGNFEIPMPSDEYEIMLPPHLGDAAPLAEAIATGQVGEAVALIPMSEAGKLSLLDAVYIARAFWPSETRAELRAKGMVAWIRDMHENYGDFPLLETDPDILDALGPLGIQRTLHIYKAWRACRQA